MNPQYTIELLPADCFPPMPEGFALVSVTAHACEIQLPKNIRPRDCSWRYNAKIPGMLRLWIAEACLEIPVHNPKGVRMAVYFEYYDHRLRVAALEAGGGGFSRCKYRTFEQRDENQVMF